MGLGEDSTLDIWCEDHTCLLLESSLSLSSWLCMSFSVIYMLSPNIIPLCFPSLLIHSHLDFLYSFFNMELHSKNSDPALTIFSLQSDPCTPAYIRCKILLVYQSLPTLCSHQPSQRIVLYSWEFEVNSRKYSIRTAECPPPLSMEIWSNEDVAD
jgi:hypothetical protein